MAKWSGVYLEDCHKLLKKIEKWAEKQVKENDAILKAVSYTHLRAHET